MKLTRFEHEGQVSHGVVEGETIKKIKGDIFSQWDYTGESVARAHVKLLAPLLPKNIIGIGANFVGHISERPETLPDIPVFFLKPTSSVVGPEEEIVIPAALDEVKFESELAVIIGKEAKDVEEEDVLDYVFGYTVGNDVTAPQYFHEAGHWMVGKAFDTFTPLGPYIETELDPSSIRVVAHLNGEEKQNSPTELMIVPIRHMISYLSKVMTLQPGDVILTGSPLGAELVGAGAVIECSIKEIGVLRNRFASGKK